MVGGTLGGRPGCAQRLGYLGRFVLHRLFRSSQDVPQPKGNQMNKFKRAILAPLVASGTLLALMSPWPMRSMGSSTSGNITDVACDINGQAPGAGNVTNVDLGIVAPTHFTAVGTNSTFRSSTWSSPVPAAPMTRRFPSPSIRSPTSTVSAAT